MSQSLYTAMGGISAAQTNLNVISNNIANLNTTGFKGSKVNFSEIYSSTLSSGTAATETTGGVNPMQVGLGVQISSISKDFTAGTWVATGKTTDLMIQGTGFFSVRSSDGEIFYTRAGDFSFDSDGDLVTSDGYKVLGTDSILSKTSSSTAVHIPQSIVATVSANKNIAAAEIAKLNNCSLTNGKFDLKYNSASPLSINIDNNTNTTVSALTKSIQAQIDAPGSPCAGNVTVNCSNGGIQFTTKNPADTLTFSNPAVGASSFVVDTGLATATKDSTGTYSSKILDYHADVTQVTSIAQATSISSYNIGKDGSIQATYSNGATLAVRLNSDGATYGFKYTTAEGVVITGDKVNVDPNVASPSNFQIQLASITNEDGLISMGSNLYSAGPNSGDIFYSIGNAMGLGKIASGGLEASNVDLSEQFSAMILAQRAVQANSRVFTTTSDIMDVVVNMGR